MKRQATALLVLAAVVFVVAHELQRDHGWAGYVRATAEAAMVGGLADWFAVTALFRHPLRLPIPHTAIIPTRKNEIGASLGVFVQDNFLSADLIGERVAAAAPAAKVAAWLARPGSPALVAEQTSSVLVGMLDVLRDDELSAGIERAVLRRIEQVDLAPMAGRVLELATAQGRHHELVDAVAVGAIAFLHDQRDELRSRFDRESPWWVPDPLDDRIFDKIFSAVVRFLEEVSASPRHPLRRELDARLVVLVDQLKTSPEFEARARELQRELLEHPALRAWTSSIWGDIKATLVRQSADPGSELRLRIERWASDAGQRLSADPALRATVDHWVERSARHVAERYRAEAGNLIASTVERWDANETSDRIESQIGKDLQYIRINGTVVGGLAGLAIHTITQLW